MTWEIDLDNLEENTQDIVDYVRDCGGTIAVNQADDISGEIGLADYWMEWDTSYGEPARVFVSPAGLAQELVRVRNLEEFRSAIDAASDPLRRNAIVAKSCMKAIVASNFLISEKIDGRHPTIEDVATVFGKPHRATRKEIAAVLRMTLSEIAAAQHSG